MLTVVVVVAACMPTYPTGNQYPLNNKKRRLT